MDIRIKPKVEDSTPKPLIFFIGAMAAFIVIAFIWGFYEHGADQRYYDCMYDFAIEQCKETGLKDFSVKYSAYNCYPESATGFYIPSLETEEKQPNFLTETHIRTCWNRSRSLWYQLDNKIS